MKENKLKSQISTRDVNVSLNASEKINVFLKAFLSGVVVGGTIWLGINWLIDSVMKFSDYPNYSQSLIAFIMTIVSGLCGFIIFAINYQAYYKYKLNIKRLREKYKFSHDGESEIDDQLRLAMNNYFNVLLQEKILQKEKSIQFNEEEIAEYQFDNTSIHFRELQKTLLPLANQLYDELKVKSKKPIQELLKSGNQSQVNSLLKTDYIKRYIENNLQPIINEYIKYHPLKKLKSNEKKSVLPKIIMTVLKSFLKTTALILIAQVATAAIVLGNITMLSAVLLTAVIGGSLFAASFLIGLVIGGITGLFEQRLLTNQTSLVNQEEKNLKLLEMLAEFKNSTKHERHVLSQKNHEMVLSNKPHEILIKKHETINTQTKTPDKQERNPTDEEKRHTFSIRK